MKLILTPALIALLVGSAHAQTNPHPQIPEWARAVEYCRAYVASTVDPQFDAFVSQESRPGQEGRVRVLGTERGRYTFAKCMTQVGQGIYDIPIGNGSR